MEDRIKKLGKFTFFKNYIYETHTHSHREMIYVISGQCIMQIDNSTLSIAKGQGVAINDNVEHDFYVVGCSDCVITHVEYESNTKFNVPRYVRLKNAEFINSGINCLRYYGTDRKYLGVLSRLQDIEIQKMQILSECEYDLDFDGKSDKKLFNEIIEYINECLYEECCFEKISLKFGITSRYLRKMFSDEIGISPVVYLTSMRIENAKKLLMTTSLSISDVAFDLGYNTVQYFSEVFRKNTGISPRDFRKINAKD